MHFRLTTFASLAAFVALAAHAAPMPNAGTLDLSTEARAFEDDSVLEMREIEDLEIDARDFEEDLLEEREFNDDIYDLTLREFFEELEERGKFGFGLRKQPDTATFKTPTAKYTGKEVNKAAKDALKHVEAGTKDRGYPKPGSGFRKSEAHKDPTKGKGESYHAPLKKKGAPHPGPDRVIVNKKAGQTKFTSHVAHHDAKNPIPKGTGAKNHPFSGGKQKFDGKGRGKK